MNENVCLNAWIFFSWMIMHILKHEILFFIFIFLNDNAWNSIFLYVQIFKWYYKWWFFSVNFSKTCFKKICTNFPKEKICTKDIFIDFQMFESLCTKEYFLMISSNVYSKCLYKDFSKYIYFMYIQKGVFQWFFLKCIYKKNLKYLKNMYINFFFFSKLHYVESEVLGNHWIH